MIIQFKYRQTELILLKATIIGSVPGYHRQSVSDFSKWGLERLAAILRQNVEIPESCSSQLILQVLFIIIVLLSLISFLKCSSLPNSPEKWFNSLCSSMSESMNPGTKSPKVCIIYPTVRTASNR